MDPEGDGKLANRGIQVSTNSFLQGVGNKLPSPQEDSNRNWTNFSKTKHTKGDLCSSSKLIPASINGPNGLVNGVDIDKYEVKYCDSTVCKQSSKNSSSLCEKCVLENDLCEYKLTCGENRDGSFQVCEKSFGELTLNSNNSCVVTTDVPSSELLSAVCNASEDQDTGSSSDAGATASPSPSGDDITYVSYENEHQMPDIMRLIQKDLSEPYSIYTYRYFIHKWPQLCFLALHESNCVGAIVCKLDLHRKVIRRGYIAMLAVDEKYRKRKIGTNLVLKAIRAMVADNADEIVLETEISNHSALRLYENLGFVRDKRLFRYYLNGVDALRLKLWLR